MMVMLQAHVPGYHKPIWFKKSMITNIIALRNLIQQYHVMYDSINETFMVHQESHGKPNMQFWMHSSGLHYFDPRDESFTFINTITENMKQFTKQQIQRAEVARSLYAKLSYPSMKDFKWVVQSNQIKDCPVTVQDIDITTKVWGKDMAALKGKTTRHKPLPVAMNLVKIPKELLKLHKEVFLMADIFFVNKIPFFLTLSHMIYFMAVNHLTNRTMSKIFKAFKEIYQYYLHQGFCITTMHMDGEFKPLKLLIEALPGGPHVNLASMNEHVPEIEQCIRVIKEHARATHHSMPFSRIPKLLVIHIVLKSIKLLNFFPSKGGLSDTLSPKTIMSG